MQMAMQGKLEILAAFYGSKLAIREYVEGMRVDASQSKGSFERLIKRDLKRI